MAAYSCTRTRHQPTEFELHKFCIEASDLGIPPGVMPGSIATDLGNRMPFVLRGRDEHGTMIYAQAAGCIVLHVLND